MIKANTALLAAILSISVAIASDSDTNKELINLENYDLKQITAVDFTAPLWVTPLPVKSDKILVEKIKTQDTYALDVKIEDTSLNNPGIMLMPPKGQLYWDLSGYEHLCVDVENMDNDQQVILSVRITNPRVNTYQIANNSGFGLNPGEKKTLKLYYPQADVFTKCRIDGLRATPPGIPGLKNVDPKRVDGIIFWGHDLKNYSRKHSAHYRISNIRLEEPYKGPQAPVNDPDKFFPFVDRYGQYIHQDWADKIHSDDDFKKILAKEKDSLHPRINTWNKWGGWTAGPQLKATGYFRTEKYQGKWFLVDPDGRLFFSHGVNAIRSGSGGIPADKNPSWFASDSIKTKNIFEFPYDNLKRKYGNDVAKIYPDIVDRRLESWGLNTIGNWSDVEFSQNHKTAYTMEIMLPGKEWKKTVAVPGLEKGLWDVFDPDFETLLKKRTLDKRMEGAANDPWCIGFFLGNEIKWGDRTAAARSAFASPASQGGKIEMVRFLKTKYIVVDELNKTWRTSYKNWDEVLNSQTLPDQDLSFEDMLAFNRIIFEKFYSSCRKIVKEFSPNTLYLGSRIHLSSMPELYETASKYCDIVSRNIYSWSMDGYCEEGLSDDVPIMVTEFHVGVLDRGMFNADMRPAGISQDDRAHAYLRIIEGILLHKQAVGAHWFCYRDQPLTGRFDGENLAIGLVDVADTPYWELTSMMRKVGEHMMEYRLNDKFESAWDKSGEAK